MNTWFECKVRYEKIDEHTGKSIKVNAPYLIDAVSYTEAETRIHEEMGRHITGEFAVKGIKQANYADIFFYDEGELWYKVKTMFVAIDENLGKEKKVANWMLVMADNVKEGCDRINESMNGMTVDFTIHSVIESNILDVFPYNLKEKAEELDGNSKAFKE